VFDATGKEYNPTCLVSDAAGSISRGFEKAFGYKTIHEYSRVVKRATFQRLVNVPSSLRENIREDLYVLQASQSRYLFNTAVK